MIQHFIITRFSYRGTNLSHKKKENPLKEKNLKHRFSIFEMTCLPGVLNQTNQDFTWILIVDPQLPLHYRNRLLKLISKKKEAFLVNYSPDLKLNKLTWLKPFVKPGTTFVNTIKLDDDDILFNEYTQYCSKYLAQVQELEPITFLACGKELYWDFYTAKDARFGYLKTIKTLGFPPSAGFAVCCKYPEINFSIESFEHTIFNYLRNDSNGHIDILPRTKYYFDFKRTLICNEIEKSKLARDGGLTEKNFHVISTEHPQAISINHFHNIQFRRLFTDSQQRKPVNPELFVPGFKVDFNEVEKKIVNQNKSLKLLFRLIKRHFLFTPNRLRKASFQAKVRDRLIRTKAIITGFVQLK